jgi:hypothetical protein
MTAISRRPRSGPDRKAVREGSLRGREGMVPGPPDPAGQTVKEAGRRHPGYFRLFAVHQPFGVGHDPAERLADGLMPQADAQQRNVFSGLRGGPDAYAGVLGWPRPRRKDDVDGRNSLICPSVSSSFLRMTWISGLLFRQADKGLGKTVVVVNQQDHRPIPPCAVSSARTTTALALLMHS